MERAPPQFEWAKVAFALAAFMLIWVGWRVGLWTRPLHFFNSLIDETLLWVRPR